MSDPTETGHLVPDGSSTDTRLATGYQETTEPGTGVIAPSTKESTYTTTKDTLIKVRCTAAAHSPCFDMRTIDAAISSTWSQYV